MKNIFEISSSQRSSKWEVDILKQLSSLSEIYIKQYDIYNAEDGWPYLLLSIKPVAEQNPTSLEKLIDWLCVHGVGFAFNKGTEEEYVCPFGQVWGCRHFKSWDFIDTKIELEDRDYSRVKVVPPRETSIPGFVQYHLKSYLEHIGLGDPKWFEVHSEKNNENEWRALNHQKRDQVEICFSAESLGLTEEKDKNEFLKHLSWFFPTHYILGIASEKQVGPFFDLPKTSNPK